MKVLIAYDGSDCAVAALNDLRRAGLPREAQATIITVSEVWLPPPSSYEIVAAATVSPGINNLKPVLIQSASRAEPVTEARSLALEAKRCLQTSFPAWEIRAEEASGSPAREILEKADHLQPDLITVGSQGRSGLARFVLGSVSHKVVNEAHCSVRVARGTVWKDGAPVRMLLGLDGSPASEAAVETVATRVWPLASEARIVTVVDPLKPAIPNHLVPPIAKWISGERHDKPTWVAEFVEAAAKKLRAAELIVSTKIEEGDPKRLLIADAEEWGAECIFIGASCAHSPFEKFLLGSVATAVVVRAHCSVEVVRAGLGLLVSGNSL
jgi:nucleotide-binding universal stress UspA family protein